MGIQLTSIYFWATGAELARAAMWSLHAAGIIEALLAGIYLRSLPGDAAGFREGIGGVYMSSYDDSTNYDDLITWQNHSERCSGRD